MIHDQARFFDPISCPNCRAPLPAPAPGLVCPRCAIALAGPTGLRLAGLLRDADRSLVQLRRERDARSPQSSHQPGLNVEAHTTPPPRFAPSARPNHPIPSTYSVPPVASPARRGSLSVGPAAILLGLGGLCLVVAVIVFLSRSWTALSLGEKVAVIGGVTLLLAATASYVTRKNLRGSAETLWAITFADLGLDVMAGRRANLFGWHAIPLHLFTGLGASVVALAAAGCLTALRSRLLVSPQLAVAGAGSTAFMALLSTDSLPSGLSLTCSVLTVGGLALAVRRLGWQHAAVTAGGLAVLPWLGLVAAGAFEALEGDYARQLSHGHANNLPLAALLAIAAAAVPAVLRATWLRTAVAAAGLMTFEFMLVAAVDSYLPWPTALAVGLGLATLIGMVRPTVWSTAAAIAVAGLASLTVPVLTIATATGAAAGLGGGSGLWHTAADHHLTGWTLATPWTLVTLLVVAAITAVRYLPTQGAWIGPVGTVSAVAIGLNAHPAAWLAVAGWLAAAVVAGSLAQRPVQLAPSAIALSLGLLTALPSDLNSGWAYLVGAILTVLVARRLNNQTSATLTELAALAQLLIAVAAATHTVSPLDGTPAVAGLLAVAAVSAVIALTSPTRRWWQWLAFAAATGAGWIEAAVRQLHAPELYCVPLGVIVLAFGIREARRRELSSWLSYGPGLVILTGPTTVLALAEPLTWRAWVTGATALLMTLAGSRLKLQSPLLIGAFSLGLLVLREAGPYAMALPRWAGIAAVGLVLLATGITWENRLANLRQVRRQLAELS